MEQWNRPSPWKSIASHAPVEWAALCGDGLAQTVPERLCALPGTAGPCWPQAARCIAAEWQSARWPPTPTCPPGAAAGLAADAPTVVPDAGIQVAVDPICDFDAASQAASISREVAAATTSWRRPSRKERSKRRAVSWSRRPVSRWAGRWALLAQSPAEAAPWLHGRWVRALFRTPNETSEKQSHPR